MTELLGIIALAIPVGVMVWLVKVAIEDYILED